MSFKFIKKIHVILIILIALGFLVRLYRFDSPIADWHSWRQADTSSVSRNFVENGFDIFHPRFDDLSNVPSGLDNPQGYRFVEFPTYNILQAGFYMIFGSLTLEQWGRLVTIIFSLVSSLFLYLLVKKRSDELTAIATIFFFLFLPFNVFYTRTILPDPSMVTYILGGIYFFDLWISERSNNSKKNIYIVSSLIFWALALLVKPFSVFFTLPMIYLAYEKYGLAMLKKWQLWAFAILSVLPFVLWRMWMSQFPSGIPQSFWLFNGNNIRFKGAFFNWIFANRISEIILGNWGVAILIIGILVTRAKNYKYFFSFALSSLVYLFVVATGNVQHSYYQILIIPSIAIFLGLGSSFLLNTPKEFSLNPKTTVLTLLICTVFLFAFSWYQVRDYFNINNPSIIVAGEAVDKLTPKNAKIIANYDGDTSFLYQTKRKGWASFEKPLPEMIQMGASFLVLENPTDADLGLGKTYKIVSVTKAYVLFDLTQKP